MPLDKKNAKALHASIPRAHLLKQAQVELSALPQFTSAEDQKAYGQMVLDQTGEDWKTQKGSFQAWCDRALGEGVVVQLATVAGKDTKPVQASLNMEIVRELAGEQKKMGMGK